MNCRLPFTSGELHMVNTAACLVYGHVSLHRNPSDVGSLPGGLPFQVKGLSTMACMTLDDGLKGCRTPKVASSASWTSATCMTGRNIASLGSCLAWCSHQLSACSLRVKIKKEYQACPVCKELTRNASIAQTLLANMLLTRNNHRKCLTQLDTTLPRHTICLTP